MTKRPNRKTVLVPIDFSEVSNVVLAQAADLARANDSHLVILHVVQPPPITDADAGVQMSTEYAAIASETAARRLEDLQKQLKARSIASRVVHKIGLPGRCIVEEAAKLSADYIVLGSHGHGAFHDLIVGSTTSRVLKQAKCPVVVVPPSMTIGRRRK